MQPAVLVRFWPKGPWRFGATNGSPNQVDSLFRSDRFFSALTLASERLGFRGEWLETTAQSTAPTIALSSLFPFQGDTSYVMPPATLWPPPANLISAPSPVFLTRVRWTAARFIPTTLAETILLGQKVLADQWLPDPESDCLLRRDRPSTPPFRSVSRSGAAVDRVTQSSGAVHSFAGVEFEPGAGLWGVIRFSDVPAAELWQRRVEGLIRLLADSGLGGRRSAGWGQVDKVEFSEAPWPKILFPKVARAESSESTSYWTLSLFSPGPTDEINWQSGDYQVVERGSATGLRARFVAEGSVLSTAKPPIGVAVNVAPDHSAHPVYRSGIVLALQLPILGPSEADLNIVETTIPEELAEDPTLGGEPSLEEVPLEGESRSDIEVDLPRVVEEEKQEADPEVEPGLMEPEEVPEGSPEIEPDATGEERSDEV